MRSVAERAIMPDKHIFDRYLVALRKTPLDDKTEHTDRSALQSLLQGIADDVADDLTIHHETKQKKITRKPNGNDSVKDKKGAPDFKITKRGGLILGYVENKAIGENLDKVLKSEQIAKYKSLSQNIVLTDYLHFIWINKDGIQRETLCHGTDLENPKHRIQEDRVAAVTKLLEAFSRPPLRVSGARSSLHWRSQPAANCYATTWVRNSCGRSASTRKRGCTGYSKYFAIKSSTS
jgi:hypothetical protein